MKLVVYFSTRILRYNVALSLLAMLFLFVLRGLGGTEVRTGIFHAASGYFFSSFLTFGFVFSVFLYLRLRPHELPLYENHGLRLSRLVFGAYAAHVLLALIGAGFLVVLPVPGGRAG